MLEKRFGDCIFLHLIEIEHRRYRRSRARNRLGIVVIQLQIAWRENLRIGQDYGPFHSMPERTDIARPVVIDKCLFCSLRKGFDVLAILSRVDIDVVARDRQDIGSALAQWRYRNFDSVQPE